MRTIEIIKRMLIIAGMVFSVKLRAFPHVVYEGHHVSQVRLSNHSQHLVTMISFAPYARVPPPCGLGEKPGETCSFKALQPDCWIYVAGQDSRYKRLWLARLRLYPKSGDIDHFTQIKISLPSGEHAHMPSFFHACKPVSIGGNITEDCPLTIKVFDSKVEFYAGDVLEGTMGVQPVLSPIN